MEDCRQCPCLSLFPFFEPVLVTMVAAHAVGRTASLWRPHLSTWQDTAGLVMLPQLLVKTWSHTPRVGKSVDVGFAELCGAEVQRVALASSLPEVCSLASGIPPHPGKTRCTDTACKLLRGDESLSLLTLPPPCGRDAFLQGIQYASS